MENGPAGSFDGIVQRLSLMARRAVSGNVLVRFQSEYSRLEVIDRLRRNGTALAEVELPDYDVLGALQAADARTVSISGFERHAVHDRLHPLFLEMNLRRERIGELDKLLIWWATPEIANQIGSRIPDFESWFLYRLELSEDLTRMPFAAPPGFAEVSSTIPDAAELFDERMERGRRSNWQPGSDAERERYTVHILKLLPQIQDRREREIRLDRFVAWAGSPKTAEAMILLSRAYRGVERLQDAEALIRRASAVEHVSADVGLELGSVLMELGRLNEAEEALERALRLCGGSQELRHSQIEALRRLAWIQQKNGMSGDALGSLREASLLLEADHHSIQALLVQESLGEQLMSLGRSAEAVPILLAAAKAAGRSDKAIQFRVTLMAATALRNQGRYREALAVMDDGPVEIGSLGLSAEILTVLGEPGKALEKARQASALLSKRDPKWIEENWKQCVDVMRTIAWTEWRYGSLASAVGVIRESDTLVRRHQAEINPIADNVTKLYRIAAEILLESGEFDDATECIRRALATAKGLQLALSCAVLARVLRAKGEKDEASGWLAKAHNTVDEISNPNKRNHAKAGVFYHQSFTAGTAEAVSFAAKSLEAYQSLQTEFPERWRTRVADAQVLLAKRMQDAGMNEEAKTQYRECLAFLADDQSEFARKLRQEIESALRAA